MDVRPLFIVAALLGAAPTLATAQTQADICSDFSKPAAERLKACDGVVEDEGLPAEARARAFAHRGFARMDVPAASPRARREAMNQATVDAGEAVRLAPQEPLGHVLRGTTAEIRDDPKLARADYDKAASLAPIFETFLARGRLLRRLGETDAAIADFDRAIALGPNYASGYVGRGLVWFDREDYARALLDFTKAAEVEPASTVPLFNQGAVLVAMDRYAEAIPYYDRMLAAVPPDPTGYGARAHARYHLGDLQAALADRRAFVRAASRNANAWTDLGSLLMEMGDHRGGLAAYGRADKLAPLNPYMLNERCWWRAVVGRELKEAIADCEAAIRLDRTSSAYVDSRGFVKFRAGDLAGALADFETALRMAPGKPGSLFMRGATLKALGRGGDADIASALAKKPGIKAEYEKYGVRF